MTDDANPASTTLDLEAVVTVLTAEWEAEKAEWWARKKECSDYDHDSEAGCNCSYKDCYEHGKWHSCSHGEPAWGPRAIEAVVRHATS